MAIIKVPMKVKAKKPVGLVQKQAAVVVPRLGPEQDPPQVY